jgi:hypothetical protein
VSITSKTSLFFALDCKYKGKKLKKLLKQNKIDLFTLSENQMTKAIKELKVFLGIPSRKLRTSTLLVQSNNTLELLKILVKYYFPFISNFKSQLKPLTDESWKTIKKLVLNDWYSFRLQDNSKLIKMTTSEFFNNLKLFFSDITDKHKKNQLKYKVFSAHDTLLVNIISNLLDKEFLRRKVFSAVEDDSDFNFVVPPFSCNLFFELHREDKIFKVKIILDGWNITPNIQNNTEGSQLMNLETFMNLVDSLVEKEYKFLNCFQEENLEHILVKPQKIN